MPTVAAEVALGTGARRVPAGELRAIVESCLMRVRMLDLAEASTGTLSGGQKQRLAIAAALAQGPPAPRVHVYAGRCVALCWRVSCCRGSRYLPMCFMHWQLPICTAIPHCAASGSIVA
jgi:hypothetical protein